PSARRDTIATSRGTIWPVSLNPWLKVAIRLFVIGASRLLRNPTTGTVDCCACEANGIAAAPPSNRMNSRRFIAALDAQDASSYRLKPGSLRDVRCPLWVKSRHVQRNSQCLLWANSGHGHDEQTHGLAVISLLTLGCTLLHQIWLRGAT